MADPKINFWQFQASLSQRLMRWARVNISLGTTLTAQKDRFWRGFGAQCVGWGLINAALAGFGLRNSQRKQADEDAQTDVRQDAARRNLARILWINTGLDVLYMAGGITLAQTKGREDRFWRGTGHGITVQGIFLFWFDLLHALQLTNADPSVERE